METPPDYTALITAVSACIAALTGLVAAVGVLLSKLRGDRIERNQVEAKVAVVQAVSTAQAVSAKLDDNTRKTEEIAIKVDGVATKHDEERRVLTDKVDELKEAVNVATVKEAIRDALAPLTPPPGIVPKRATDILPKKDA